MVLSSSVYSQSLNFRENKINFGSSSSDFISVYSDYELSTDENTFENLKIYCKNIQGGDDKNFYFNTKIYFINDKLFMISIDEWFAPENYRNILRNLKKQFKVTKEESSEEEGGWFHQDLKKGKLVAVYDEGDAASNFKCYEENMFKEVKQQYPAFNY